MHRSNGPSLGLGAALCLLLFGTAAQGPPIWQWIFFVAVLAGGTGLWWINRQATRPMPEPQPVPGPPAPAEQPYEVVRVEDVSLSSAVADYDFRFSASIWWRPFDEQRQGENPARSGQAIAAIISRAQAVTQEEQPGRWDSAQYRLEGSLGAVLPDETFSVMAMASHVTLTLAPGDRERLDNLATLRKTQATWHHERQHERDRRHYFATEILNTPGSAVTWWLARHDDEIERAVDLIGPLAQLAAASNDAEVPELFRHLVSAPSGPEAADPLGGFDHPAPHPASPHWNTGPLDSGPDFDPVLRHAHRLLDNLRLDEDSDERSVFLHRLIGSTEAAGRPAAAQRLRDFFFPRDPDDLEPPAPSSPRPPGPIPSQPAEHSDHPTTPDDSFYADLSSPSWARRPEPDGPQPHRPESEGTWGGES